MWELVLKLFWILVGDEEAIRMLNPGESTPLAPGRFSLFGNHYGLQVTVTRDANQSANNPIPSGATSGIGAGFGLHQDDVQG